MRSQQTSPVFRFESSGESGVPFPRLSDAIRYVPFHGEAQVRTSIDGVVLAEAEEVCGPGSLLRWVLTLAGQDVVDAQGWRAPLSPREVDTVLVRAIGEELAVAS